LRAPQFPRPLSLHCFRDKEARFISQSLTLLLVGRAGWLHLQRRQNHLPAPPARTAPLRSSPSSALPEGSSHGSRERKNPFQGFGNPPCIAFTYSLWTAPSTGAAHMACGFYCALFARNLCTHLALSNIGRYIHIARFCVRVCFRNVELLFWPQSPHVLSGSSRIAFIVMLLAVIQCRVTSSGCGAGLSTSSGSRCCSS